MGMLYEYNEDTGDIEPIIETEAESQRQVFNQPISFAISESVRDAVDDVTIELLNRARNVALNSSANLLDSAGCLCYIIEAVDGDFSGTITNHSPREVLAHDACCPVTLAAEIRKGITS